MDGVERVLVVGASSGIGRAVAATARAAGLAVAVGARRVERLDGDVVIEADVRVADDCDRMVETAIDGLGGLDALVYAAGVSPLTRLSESNAEVWHDTLSTNVVGAALVTQAALRPGGLRRALYLSSQAAARPWPGLGVYSTSKVALDRLVEAWQVEHPDVSFCRVIVGHTATGFADEWDPALAAELITQWQATGLLTGPIHTPEVVAAAIVDVLAAPADPPPVADVVDLSATRH